MEAFATEVNEDSESDSGQDEDVEAMADSAQQLSEAFATFRQCQKRIRDNKKNRGFKREQRPPQKQRGRSVERKAGSSALVASNSTTSDGAGRT